MGNQFAASLLVLTESCVESNIKGLHCGQVFALGGTQTQQLASRLAVSPWVHRVFLLPDVGNWGREPCLHVCVCMCMCVRLGWNIFYFFFSVYISIWDIAPLTPAFLPIFRADRIQVCEFTNTVCSPGRTGALCFCARLRITFVAKCVSVLTCVSKQGSSKNFLRSCIDLFFNNKVWMIHLDFFGIRFNNLYNVGTFWKFE